MKDKLATLERDGWELESGEERAKEYADTFEIPSNSELSLVKVGNLVKLIFIVKAIDKAESENLQVERMWVYVTETQKGMFIGRLQNKPKSNTQLLAGTEVKFRVEHIIDIADQEPPKGWKPTLSI